MKRFVLVVACCVLSTGAFAQTSVPKEITGYRQINVSFSEGAKKCNLEHRAEYQERLREKLAGIGVVQSDENYSVISLGVSGQRFGLIGGHCVTMVELNFVAALSKDNIVTSDQRVREVVDKIGIFPISLYKDGMFAVQAQEQPAAGGESTKSKEAALKMIDDLVGNLANKRK